MCVCDIDECLTCMAFVMHSRYFLLMTKSFKCSKKIILSHHNARFVTLTIKVSNLIFLVTMVQYTNYPSHDFLYTNYPSTKIYTKYM